MNIIRRLFILIVLFVSNGFAIVSAREAQPDTLAMRMWRQVNAFPQEKLYTQTDRSIRVATRYGCATMWLML